MTKAGATSVLVVDDHPGFRSAARTLLERMGLEVVAEAETGEDAIALSEALRPDLLLLDVQLPGMDGIEVARQVMASHPSPVVILTSSRDEEQYGARLRVVPHAAFIAKSDLSPESLGTALAGGSR